jgi:ATP synthase protein I
MGADQADPNVVDVESAMTARSRQLARRSLGVLLASALVALALGAVIGGAAGLLGATIGAALVIVFFGVDLLLLQATRRTPPLQVLAVVAMVYTLKITLLAVFLVALRGTTAFSASAFAVAVIGLTTVALGCAVVLVAKRPAPVVTPEPGPGVQPPGPPADGVDPAASVETR